MTAAALLPTFVKEILGAVGVSVTDLPLFCNIDATSRPSATCRAAASSRTLWVVLLIWPNIIASVVYLASVRPGLEAAKVLP